MPGKHNVTMAELEAFLEMLEQARLDYVEAVINQLDTGYTDDQLAKLATQAAAVQCVRDAIAYRREFDSR